MMTLNDARTGLYERLKGGGFDDALARVLSELLQPCVRFATEPTPDAAIPVGHSKVGGLPDLPKEARWPAYKGRSMAFLAQIDLGELRCYEAEAELPREGLLSFFYDVTGDVYGSPEDRGGWAVVLSDKAALARRSLPDDMPFREGYSPSRKGFHSCRIRAWGGFSAPTWESPQLRSFDLSDKQDDAFLEAWTQTEEGAQAHQMLGYPVLIQGPMEEECQQGLEPLVSSRRRRKEARAKLDEAARAARWRLLFQLDADEHAGMEWGDEGRLYFWVREADLLLHRFDDVWMVSQCH